jgi:hypothetical protein
MAATESLLEDLLARRARGAEDGQFHDDLLHMVTNPPWL